jgi:hypothetical protein
MQIRDPLVVGKDSVKLNGLNEVTIFVSEVQAFFDLRNHLIEFDPRAS